MFSLFRVVKDTCTDAHYKTRYLACNQFKPVKWATILLTPTVCVCVRADAGFGLFTNLPRYPGPRMLRTERAESWLIVMEEDDRVETRSLASSLMMGVVITNLFLCF